MTIDHPIVQEVYANLEPWKSADASGDLLKFVSALAGRLEEVYDLARDRDDVQGWSPLFDADNASMSVLRYMAQFVGVRLIAGLTDEQQRLRVKETSGFARGTVAAIAGAARQTLTGQRRVLIYERDTSAYHFTVRTYEIETPDPALTEAVLRAEKPAGLVMTYETAAGASYTDLDTAYGTFDDEKAAFGTFTDQALWIP